MASESVSSLILFIASLVVAAGVAGTLTTGVQRVSSSIDEGSLDTAQQIRTDVEIVNDPGRDYTSGGQLTLYVKNTGTQGILNKSESFDIVFNGQFVQNSDITISDANGNDIEAFREGDVAEIEIQSPDIASGDNRVFLTVNSDEEVLEFRT
ncbi:MAG: putative archaeal flagellar protein G [uncultured archaeon A07HN63]|jgi:Putative archaeal flagellar protein G|nr:MAG: putative archaeal flagellar protein G [uncultured archaeon A07HN63]